MKPEAGRAPQALQPEQVQGQRQLGPLAEGEDEWLTEQVTKLMIPLLTQLLTGLWTVTNLAVSLVVVMTELWVAGLNMVEVLTELKVAGQQTEVSVHTVQ